MANTRFYLILAVLLGCLVTGCTSVPPGEKGVSLIFGKVHPGTLDSGYYVWIPFVKSVQSLSVRVQKDAVETSAASKDIQEVKAHIAINWHIDPTKVDEFYVKIGTDQDAVTNVIMPAVNEVMKSSTAKKTAEEILAKRTELKTEIDSDLRTWLGKYGVLVDDVSLVDLTFTPEFNKAVESKQIAEQQSKQAEYEAQRAEVDARAAVNKAKGDAQSTLTKAKAEAESNLVRAKAEAEANQLKLKTLTEQLIRYETVTRWDGALPTVVSGKNGLVPILNLNAGGSHDTKPDKE